MKRKILSSCLGTVLLLAAALLIAHPVVQAAPQEDNQEVSKLLEDIKMQAADLRHDSDQLEGFTESYASWESHAVELERMKDRIRSEGTRLNSSHLVISYAVF